MIHAPVAALPSIEPSPAERLQRAWQRRHESDYVFRCSTAFAWTVLTGGVYALYIFFQLMRRNDEHNRRRVELLDAAASFAWDQARAQHLTDELRPNFQRICDRTRVLTGLTTEFRDPTLWVALSAASCGIAQLIGWVVIDRDLVAHDEAERDIEGELATIYTRLGRHITLPEVAPSPGRHRVAGRIVATAASLGLYSFWWMRDLMIEGNVHLERNWRFEDELARASRSLMAAAA